MAPMKPPHLSFLASGQGALHQCPSGVEARTAELAAASSLLGRVQKPSIHAGVRSILNEEMKQLRTSNSLFRKTATECKAKLTAQAKKLREQSQLLAEQGSRLAEQEGKLNEMNRKLLEQHREFSDVLEEVSRLREQVLASCATAAGAKGGGGGEAALAVVEKRAWTPAQEERYTQPLPKRRRLGTRRRTRVRPETRGRGRRRTILPRRKGHGDRPGPVRK
uniref:Uncharacterized protein n=2 Tax=Ixodes ricinus TaxID=34613 RepID=V5GJQ3_IXORI